MVPDRTQAGMGKIVIGVLAPVMLLVLAVSAFMVI